MPNFDRRLSLSLLLLRASIFLVMFMWTIDKFINPEHAIRLYEKFYFIGGLEIVAMYVIGGAEVILLLLFLAGFRKFYTYGAVLLLHSVSTFSAFKQYLSPFDGSNLLFFAAWPMLAACVALFMLRDHDRQLSLG